MSWTKNDQSTRSLVYSFAVIALAATGLWFGANYNSAEANSKNASSNVAPAATFNADAASLGLIPDAPVSGCGQTTGLTPRNVTFTVSGLSGAVSTVNVSNLVFNPIHTWGSDVTAVLIAPNGASQTLFGRTGATTATSCNDSSPLQGPYGFSDTAAAPPSGGWWQASTAATGTIPIAAGTYRTTAT
ncbi:MAG: hypothetical protein ABJA66_21495, partial [Actinomycetota bacterium]